MALGDALARHVTIPTVWWHSTDQPTLILGPAQVHTAFATEASASVPRVGRQAGGTAVFATGDVLGLDIALPLTHPLAIPDIVEAYRWLGETWIDALDVLGVGAELVSVERARAAKQAHDPLRALADAACFGGLSPYEVLVDGRKLVGLAQVRRRSGELLQAGLHLEFDADGLAGLLAPESQVPLANALRKRAVGLREVMSRAVTFDDVMAAFQKALEERYHVHLIPSDLPAEFTDYADVSLGPRNA